MVHYNSSMNIYSLKYLHTPLLLKAYFIMKVSQTAENFPESHRPAYAHATSDRGQHPGRARRTGTEQGKSGQTGKPAHIPLSEYQYMTEHERGATVRTPRTPSEVKQQVFSLRFRPTGCLMTVTVRCLILAEKPTRTSKL